MNTDNRIRQLAAKFLYNNSQGSKLSAGMSKAELDAIRAVAEGTKNRNLLRYVGNLLGGGGGLGAGMVGGMAGYFGGVLGPAGGVALGVGVPAVGAGARKAAGKLSEKAMRNADALVRSRSPLYQEMLRNAPPEPLPSAAIPLGLLKGGALASPSALELLLSGQDRR
jgi:hypothetical protein